MIRVNVDKAKAVAHDMRRQARAAEFAPHDEVIAKRLPGAVDAEAARTAIRAKYAVMQNAIDAATTPEEIKIALGAE